MGRFATYIAGRASSADKLPGQLPSVSLIDALLPRIISGSSPGSTKPLGDTGRIRGSITHTDVTKNKEGRLVMVQHRDKSGGTWSGGGGRRSASQEEKKDADDKGSNGGKADEKKDSPVDENNLTFTPEDDAKIIELKAAEPNMPWLKVGEEIKRNKDDAKERYKQLQHLGKVPPGDAKGDPKQNDPKPNGDKSNCSQQKNTKKAESKKESGEEGNWTSAEDAIIRQGMADKEHVPTIASRLKNRVNREVGQRIQYLKMQDGQQSKKGGDKEDNAEKKTKEDGKEGQQNGGKISKKEKREAKKRNEEQQESKQEDSKPKGASSKAASKAASSRSEAKFTMGEWRTLQEDDMFSFRELQLLSELIMLDARESRDGAYSWLRVASLFADRTDRRVHPEDIREKFEAMRRD